MSHPQSSRIIEFHDGRQPAEPASELWRAIEDNHRNNCLLWDEEDLARRNLEAHVPKNLLEPEGLADSLESNAHASASLSPLGRRVSGPSFRP